MGRVVLILLMLSTTSCKKDEQQTEINRSYMDDRLKSDFGFNEGSYWIYENQFLNTDSIIVSNYETGFTSTCPDNACPRYEFIKLTYENVTQEFEFNHYLMTDFIRYNGGGSFGSEGQPIHILDEDNGYEFNGLLVGEKYDSLMVQSEMFFDVQKMTIVADLQFQNEFEFDRDFYFAPSVGIIREVIYDTPNGTITWDLKSYEIE